MLKLYQHNVQKLLNQACLLVIVLVTLLLFPSCKSTDDENKPVPVTPPIDLSGVWVGTWSGFNPSVGNVSGNWEAELTQDDISVSGFGWLSGDVDCTDGPINGSLNHQYIISGTYVREPCGTNEWVITSLSILERRMSAYWTKPSESAEGTLTGIQVATPGGPRIRHFSPPGGLADTIVSVTGDRFSLNPVDTTLYFNEIETGTIDIRDQNRIVTQVPAVASIGLLKLTTPDGTAYSPASFNTEVTYPAPELIITNVNTYYPSQDIAFTPDGRRGFILSASGYNPNVAMFDVSESYIFNSINLSGSPQAIVVSPDGRYAYVSTAGRITVLHTGQNSIVDTFYTSGGYTTTSNPHGLAITPDGKQLLVADSRDNGSVSLIDINSKSVVTSLSMGAGTIPYGITISPDGRKAFIAFHGLAQVKEYDLDTYTVTGTINVGVKPTGLAITPDGTKLFVSNANDNTVSVIELTGNTTLATIPVGLNPQGLVISPDGSRLYVANYSSNQVSIIDIANDTVIHTLTTGSYPVSVAVLPDGAKAYVANSRSYSLSQIGGPFTLTITKSGTGIGDVYSTPGGISCGNKCRAEFPTDTSITLNKYAASGSSFSRWEGDADCTDGNVFMDSSKHCTAVFTKYYSSSRSYRSSASCFIATAAYGSYLNPHVQTLRDFRDNYLLTNKAGSYFVALYYKYSPPAARYIAEDENRRLIARIALTPIVYTIRHPLTTFVTCAVIILLLRHIKHNRSNFIKKHQVF